MKHYRDTLIKSFGNGVMLLRFYEPRPPSSVSMFIHQAGLRAGEFVKVSDDEVVLMMDEGLPVTVLEVRGTEEEWNPVMDAVLRSGSQEFIARMTALQKDRETVSGSVNS